MNSKLTNMAASNGLVVVTARQGTKVETIVRKCGIVGGPGDLGAFVQATGYLADNKEERRRLGRARKIVC